MRFRTTALFLLVIGAEPGICQVPVTPPSPAAVPADPYTGAAPDVLDRVGYQSLGPFRFGTNHDSDDVALLLADEPLLWIETRHFRIGASLSAYAVPAKDKEAAAQVRSELQKLAGRLPKVDPRANRLDPWLRAHLVAQRAEEVYAAVLHHLGVAATDFPLPPGDDPRRAATFRGLGPYLGMPEKFTILLVQKPTSLQRYTAAWQSWSTPLPVRFFDHRFGMAFFGASEGAADGLMRDDVALRTHLSYHVAHNLYTSYRSYGHNLPAWLVNGLAWRHARQVSTRFPIYDLRCAADPDGKRYASWAKRVAVWRKDDGMPPLAPLLERLDVASLTMDEHLQCWALVDGLMQQRPKAVAEFVHRMKDPFFDRLRFPTDEELLARQREVLAAVFGVDAGGLAKLWREAPITVARR